MKGGHPDRWTEAVFTRTSGPATGDPTWRILGAWSDRDDELALGMSVATPELGLQRISRTKRAAFDRKDTTP